jgi:hypothetical protein
MQFLFDARCPPELHSARLNFSKALEQKQRELDRSWARLFADSANQREPKRCEEMEVTAPTRSDPSRKERLMQCNIPKLSDEEAAVGPFTIKVALTETRDATQLVKALATAFSANTDPIKTALDEELNPVKKAEARAAARTALAEAQNAFSISQLKVQALEAKLVEASDRPSSERLQIQVDLSLAKIQANKDARAAGRDPPYPDFQ